MKEMQVQALTQEDPLEEVMAPHSSIHAWKLSWTEKPGGLQSMASQSQTQLSEHIYTANYTNHWFNLFKKENICLFFSLMTALCLFNSYAECIMRNAGLDEAQAGFKIAGRNINNLRYADNTTLMAATEELKSLSMKVKEESEKVG